MSFWNGHQWEGVDAHPAAATSAKPESRTKRLAAAALEGALITALTFGLIASTAFAARGGGAGGGKHGGGGTTGGSGTISLHSPLVVDKNGNGTPNWGDVVRFDVSTTSTTQPWVYLKCYQGGLVSQGSEGYFAGSLDDGNFGLYSPMWSSGAADCTATLQTPSGSVLGSTSFHVDA